MKPRTTNWGRTNRKPRAIVPFQASQLSGNVLPYGNGRSYGDTCHNDSGILLDSRSLNTILELDTDSGLLRVQSGAILGDVLKRLEGTGWFMPVVPGTRYVTLGGMLANDIHGKNHEHRGTFGRHIRGFTLHRSDREPVLCAPEENADLFAATIGGMGLTGFVEDLTVQLMRVPSSYVKQVNQPFGSIAEALEILGANDAEYSVAWLDSLATGQKAERGIALFGDHVEDDGKASYAKPRIGVPFTPPAACLAGPPLGLFNMAYFHANAKAASKTASPESYFFPLDAVSNWNRLYGPKGMHQHQCVVPMDAAETTLPAMLKAARESGHGSFLTVLKRFGDLPSPGLVSFPQGGVTLTLDFAAKGKATLALLDRLDAMVLDAGGRTNPYKDSRMSAQTYQTGYRQWDQLEALRDPAIQSDFWRRVASRKVVVPPSSTTPNKTVNHPSEPDFQTALAGSAT